MSKKNEIRDGMRIDWDVPIEMDDGVELRCDVYRPINEGRYPVILTYGPYGKYLAFQDGYISCWQRMAEEHPDVTAGSTNNYQSWEVCDPEKWVPYDYVCVRVDSRGCGLHDDPADRPPKIFGGNVTIHFDKDKQPYVLVPIVPPPQ